jgi:hypothetical protein
MIEMNIPLSNPEASMTLGGPGADGTQSSVDAAWSIRHTYVWSKHKRMGKISLGQTNGAANGKSEADFRGTGIFSGSDGDSYGHGISFKETSGTNSSTSSVTIGEAITNLDGNSRDDVIRYDSPTLGGAGLALSMTGTGVGEVGLSYSGKFGSIKVKAGAGYTDFSANTASTNFGANGSISLKHDSGLSVTFAGGKLNYAGAGSKTSTNAHTITNGVEDPNFFHWGVGYDAKLFGVGGTSFAVMHNTSSDVTQDASHDDSEAQSLRFQVVQKFSAIGAQIGVEYSRYEFESKTNTTANTFDDVDVIALMTVFAF